MLNGTQGFTPKKWISIAASVMMAAEIAVGGLTGDEESHEGSVR